MQEREQNKLIELARKAVSINEELLGDEKRFIEAVSSNQNFSSVVEINDLCSREHLCLAATKSLLQIINNK